MTLLKESMDEPKLTTFYDELEPALKPILETTYGVIVYQEQVMQIVQDHWWLFPWWCRP